MTTSRLQVEPPSVAPEDRRGSAQPNRDIRGHATALAAAVLTFALLAGVYLYPYVTKHYRYPTGWDAPAAVGRAQLVSQEGLDHFGAIRSGAPLLESILEGTTGQNEFTLVALVPAVLLGMAALGGAAIACVALGIGAWWLPVIGFLVWAAFGENGMINLHLDNMLNAALTLAGLAAALGFVAWRKGAVAVAVLFAGAGLAHWPFYVFAAGFVVVALAAFVMISRRRAPDDPFGSARGVGPLLGAVVASGAVVGLTFLWLSPDGWAGARLERLGGVLKRRFLETLGERSRYYAFLPAAGGAWAATASRPAAPRDRAWRLFLCLMGAWMVGTIVGGAAQLADFPSAGARLIHYLFPVAILTGVAVWWLARWLAGRKPRTLGVAAAVMVVIVAMGGFGTLFVVQRSNDRPWFGKSVMQQATVAGQYLAGIALDRPAVFVLGDKATGTQPARQVVTATLGPLQAARASFYWGLPDEYLAGVTSRQNGRPQSTPPEAFPGRGTDPVAIVIKGYSPAGYKLLAEQDPERIIAPGVGILLGPLPAAPLPPAEVPAANTRPRNILWVVAAMMVALFLAGSGWAAGLLPRDPILRVSLAPALGAAVLTLLGLAWDRVGLPFGGATPIFLLVTATGIGWAIALVPRIGPGR